MLNFKIDDKVSLNDDKNVYKIKNIIFSLVFYLCF